MTSGIQQRVPITAEALKDMRFVGDTHLSADGKRIAFEVEECPPGQNKGRTRIWTVDTSANKEAELLTHGKKSDLCPRWSPDGTQLAFISTGEGEKDKPQLHLINTTGGDARQVCTLPNGVSNLAWSPDGSRIAFISLAGAEPGSDPKVFTPTQERHRRLWTIRVDDDIPQAVTPDGITVWEYVWSPDGRQFALYSSTRPDETGWYYGQIGVVDASGGSVHQLTHFAPVSVQARALAWSPDGKRLAYISGKWSDPGRGAGEIFLLSLENGQPRNLTPGIACSPTWCAWFPDGRRLLYTAVEEVSHQIGILDTADGSIRVLDRSFVMQWDQPRLSQTPDLGSFATVHSTSQQPPDVYGGKLAGEGGEGGEGGGGTASRASSGSDSRGSTRSQRRPGRGPPASICAIQARTATSSTRCSRPRSTMPAILPRHFSLMCMVGHRELIAITGQLTRSYSHQRATPYCASTTAAVGATVRLSLMR